MSLVETAIKKLQNSRDAAPVDAVPAHPGFAAVPLVDSAARPSPPGLALESLKKIDINRDMLRAQGMLPPDQQERQIANEYRQIKRPLIYNATGRSEAAIPNGHLVMVASALPGEGKTFTSINLAFSMALEQDITVLLVDADVAKPHISRLFGLSEEPGLLDALLDDSLDVESLIVRTNVPHLGILPAGRRVKDTATELLTSDRMAEIVARIGARDPRRIVLLDSPPLLLTSESKALASVAGQVVLVVRAGETPQQNVLDAVSYLGEGKTVGLVLNQSETRTPGTYYGYGAYGETGSGAAEG